MKRSYTILLIVIGAFHITIQAQNLVIDPGLEDTLQCPTWIGQFHHPTNPNAQFIAHWRNPTIASADLHNVCGYNNFMPRNGDGYAGLLLYDPTEYREYVTALLSEALVAGVCYYVEFHVARSDNSIHAIDEVQVHFSTGTPYDLSSPPPAPLALTPHLQAASTPSATTYQKISGFYIASGGEDAMTIGNFMDNANTTLTQMQSSGAGNTYYYLDDVTVTRLDLGADKAICDGDVADIVPNIQCVDLLYEWSTNSNAQSIQVSTAGPVWVEISGNGNCTVADTVNIIVQSPPDAGIGGVDTICTNALPFDLIDLLGGTPESNGQWTDPNGNNTTAMVDPSTALSGAYTYFVSGNGICPDTTAVLDLYFDPCLGIDEEHRDPTISWIGQNSSGLHNFRMDGPIVGPIAYELFDAQGRSVTVPAIWTNDGLSLDLYGSAVGIYVLHLDVEPTVVLSFVHQ